MLTGRLQNRSWNDEQGQKHYVTEIIIENVEFCGTKKEQTEIKENVEEREAIQNENEFNINLSDLPF